MPDHPDGLPSSRLSDALEATATWDVPDVAAAVVGSDAFTVTVGDIDQVYRLASVTKLLTVYACLVAIEEGTLEFDAVAAPGGATVRHLLAHAGGYGFDTGPLSLPGRSRIYSNTGFDALSEHLTDRGAMPATEYVAAAVLEPLGLTATVVGTGSLAHGAWSTVRDMTHFVAELLEPTLIARATLAEATTVQFPGLDGVLPGVGPQSPNDWGLGFELRDHKVPHWSGNHNSPATFGHFGSSGTFVWVDPEIGHGLIVLTNRKFGPWALDVWPALSDAVVDVLRPGAAT